ncbi:pyridoxamine 5'-phosphate oxidase family protein [Merdibacter massiliensis]|uniref:pyridoxamine 5'-phosphate oxidase family protein n=1 Tax=Merdibacter massiliensis TaxID=1871030 RepID=UPI00096A5B18|nr:pyridoxamine 5'-phosphate oxidase family protein [Merdibacter massiliensis]
MLKKIREYYQDHLIWIFERSVLKDPSYEALVVVKKETCIHPFDHVMTYHYNEPFEEQLTLSLPGKIRNEAKLISLEECYALMKRIPFGTCAFNNGSFPYVFPINHVMIDDRIFFHCGQKGEKLKGIDQPIIYNVVEDLGITQKVGTHNYRSVHIFGTLREVKDLSVKKEVLLTFVHDLAPAHPYHDGMLQTTKILEVEKDYMIGKAHMY